MMYLLTMGWSLAHTSLAMTPEHSVINGESSFLRSARAGQSKSMCLRRKLMDSEQCPVVCLREQGLRIY